MKHARDLMNPNPIVCKDSDTLEQLLKIFLNSNYKYIPIINDKGEAVGLMDELQLVKALSDKNTKPDVTSIKHFERLYLKAHFIDASAGINEILPSMLETDSHRILVVSGSKKPLGVLSPLNILRAIVGLKPSSRQISEKLEETTKQAEDNWIGTDTKDIFFQAFEKSPYMMLVTDVTGNILECSSDILKNLDYKKEDITGKSVDFLFANFSRKQLRQSLHDANMRGKLPTKPIALQKKDGKLIEMEMAISAIRDDSKRLKYFCLVFHIQTDLGISKDYLNKK